MGLFEDVGNALTNPGNALISIGSGLKLPGFGDLAGAGGLGSLMDPDVSKQSSRAGISVAEESEQEKKYREAVAAQFGDLSGFVGKGPGESDVTAGTQSSRDLAAMLQQYAQGGNLPSASDWETANQFATKAYQPQQVAMQQAFQQQNLRANQLAAQLGRPANDPIIQAKLAQEQMQGMERLGAAQSAYASEYAQQLPQQRLGYTAQLADVRNSLASQAMANRQALLGLGQSLQAGERNWRLNTGTQWSQGQSESGGGLKGALGTIAGLASTAASIYSGFGGLGAMGGGAAAGGMSMGQAVSQFGRSSTPFVSGIQAGGAVPYGGGMSMPTSSFSPAANPWNNGRNPYGGF
jgi:hypothetical protein